MPFVLDAHTAAFLHPRWASWQWLQRALSKRAATTIVTNEHLAQLVRAAGGRATLVPDVPVRFSEVQPLDRTSQFMVAIVCSFNYDEPVAQMLDAARELPEVTFMVTGNPRHLSSSLKQTLPENVKLTGFLPDAAYAGLLIGADAVMTLTTRDHTMLRAAYEAIYQGTPVIVSDWPLLRAAFDEGAVHVDNSTPSIVEGIRRLRGESHAFREGADRLRRRKLARWSDTLAELRGAIGMTSTGAVDPTSLKDEKYEVVR